MYGEALPNLQTVLDKLGFEYAQWRIIFLTGTGIFLCDGAEMMVANVIPKPISKEWSLTATERGSIASSVWVGVFLGSILIGEVGDVYGRRLPLLVSYAGIAVFCVLSIFATGIYSLILLRGMAGFAMGIGMPCSNAFSQEVSPANMRPCVNLVVHCGFCIGQIYAASLLYSNAASMHNIDWRWLLAAAAIPSMLWFILAAALLPESPVFLSRCGRKDEALEVLAAMRKQNGMPESTSIDFAKPSQPEVVSMRYNVVFGPSMLVTTVICCWTTITVNFTQHGGVYAWAQILPELDSFVSPAGSLFVGMLADLAGKLITYPALDRLTRKHSLQLLLASMLCFNVVFLSAAELGSSDFCKLLMLIGFLGQRMSVSGAFMVIYCYISEVFPTTARVTGTGLCFGVGRIAAFLGPLTYEWLASQTEHPLSYLYFLALCAGLNLFVACFLEIETGGKALKDHADETEPLKA